MLRANHSITSHMARDILHSHLHLDFTDISLYRLF